MGKTLEQMRAENLALDIQEFLTARPECTSMMVEDFVYYLLDLYHRDS